MSRSGSCTEDFLLSPRVGRVGLRVRSGREGGGFSVASASDERVYSDTFADAPGSLGQVPNTASHSGVDTPKYAS